MPRVVSAYADPNWASQGDDGFARYFALGQSAREQASREKDRALQRQRYQLELDQATRGYEEEQAQQAAAREYDLGKLQASGGERVQAQASEGVSQQRAAASFGVLGSPVFAALSKIVPEELQKTQAELGRLEGIAGRMSPDARAQLVADYEAGTLQRFHAAASQRVLGQIEDMRSRGQLAIEGEQGKDGAQGPMGADVELQLQVISQGLKSGKLDALTANEARIKLRDAVVKENARRAFFQQGLRRVERELKAVEPASQDAEELAFVRARWLAGDIENGDDLEDAIFEARTGRKTARASAPKTPEETYVMAAEMMLKLNPAATQEQIDQAFRMLAAGPPEQRPKEQAPVRQETPEGRAIRDPGGAVKEAYQAAKSVPRGTRQPQAKTGKGDKAQGSSWQDATDKQRKLLSSTIQRAFKEAGSKQEFAAMVAKAGISLGSIPPEELQRLRDEAMSARKAKDQDLDQVKAKWDRRGPR